jgi:hypothetical protein
MEQANKRSSSHEGGLLHDPLHKGTRFPSVPKKDCKDGRQRVSAQSDVPVSGFPLPVSRSQAVPEPEMLTRFSSQATTSNQSTDLLLQQLMAKMKYLRERVDTLPTGLVQGVAVSLETSQEVPEPSSQTISSFEDMEVPARLSETSTSTANPQVSEMAYFRALIRKHVNTEVCPLPPENPSLRQPKFMLFGALAPPRPEDPRLSTKAFAALPPSPSVIDCCNLLCNTVGDSVTGSVGHQRTSIATLDSCGPGAWTAPGKLFTHGLPAVDKYRLLGHMVSKRFARPGYYPARSSSGFRVATTYNLNSQSCGPSTGLGQG